MIKQLIKSFQKADKVKRIKENNQIKKNHIIQYKFKMQISAKNGL